MKKRQGKRYARSLPDDNHYPRTPDTWLTTSACLANLLLLLVLGGVMIWLAARSIPGLIADPDPVASAAAIVAIAGLVSLIIKILSHLRLVIVEHQYLSADVEMDILRLKLIEDYVQDHPPTTPQELNALLDQFRQSELHRHELVRQYYQNIEKRDAGLWNRLMDWFIKGRK